MRALLERAVSYTLGIMAAVTPADLSRPTPCQAWDLEALLNHLNDSMDALQEGATGCVGPPMVCQPDPHPVAGFRQRATKLVGAWVDPECRDRPMVAVSDLALPAAVVAATGALEIAVHGWDIARTCGLAVPIPDALAAQLLAVATLLVAAEARHPEFADPVAVSARASPNDRLVGYLGRTP